MNEEDVFESENNGHDKEADLFSKSLNRVFQPLRKEGFREGVTAGKDKTFQKGFDTGYSIGFQTGLKLGYFNGVQKILESKGIQSETGFQDPTRGFCHLCPNKNEGSVESSSNYNKPVKEIIEKQNYIVTEKIAEKNTCEYKRTLSDLHLPLE